MRVTYYTKVVWKPSVCFFSYWKFLKVSGSFCITVKTRAGTSNISANQKRIHFFWAAFSLRNDHTVYSAHCNRAVPCCQWYSRSPGFGCDWCLPGWALWKAPGTWIPCSLLWERCWFLNSYLLLSGGQIPARPMAGGASPHFVAEILPQNFMDSQQSYCEDTIAAMR